MQPISFQLTSCYLLLVSAMQERSRIIYCVQMPEIRASCAFCLQASHLQNADKVSERKARVMDDNCYTVE